MTDKEAVLCLNLTTVAMVMDELLTNLARVDFNRNQLKMHNSGMRKELAKLIDGAATELFDLDPENMEKAYHASNELLCNAFKVRPEHWALLAGVVAWSQDGEDLYMAKLNALMIEYFANQKPQIL